jgi:hypothetical protein
MGSSRAFRITLLIFVVCYSLEDLLLLLLLPRRRRFRTGEWKENTKSRLCGPQESARCPPSKTSASTLCVWAQIGRRREKEGAKEGKSTVSSQLSSRPSAEDSILVTAALQTSTTPSVTLIATRKPVDSHWLPLKILISRRRQCAYRHSAYWGVR